MGNEDAPAERNARLVRRYLEDVWNDGDIQVVDEIFGDIENMRRKWGNDIEDREELKSYLGSLVGKYQNDSLTVRTVLANDQEVMAFWEMEMQLVDDHLGIKPSGRAASRRGVTYGRVEDGRLARVIDISDSRELMPRVRRLARSELMASMHEGVVIVDDENLVVDINDVALSAFGWGREEALDRPYREVLDTDEPIPDTSGTTEIEAADGTRVFEASTSVVSDPKDERVGRALVLRDITNRKHYQERLQVLNRVLRHNLRNDMNSIRGRAEYIAGLAREDSIDPDVVEEIAREISTVADDLIELGEKAGTLESLFGVSQEVRAEDLATVATEVVKDVLAGYPSVSITTEFPESVRVLAVPGLEAAIEATVENACQHNDAPDPEVTASIEDLCEEPYVRLRVVDNGPGIPDHERRVVETGEEHPLEHGSGLGLWLIRWVVVRSGGRLRFEDPPRGTAVLLDFPQR